jgi:hypothetical protein
MSNFSVKMQINHSNLYEVENDCVKMTKFYRFFLTCNKKTILDFFEKDGKYAPSCFFERKWEPYGEQMVSGGWHENVTDIIQIISQRNQIDHNEEIDHLIDSDDLIKRIILALKNGSGSVPIFDTRFVREMKF